MTNMTMDSHYNITVFHKGQHDHSTGPQKSALSSLLQPGSAQRHATSCQALREQRDTHVCGNQLHLWPDR